MPDIGRDDLRVLGELDEVWMMFDEVYVVGMTRRTLRNRLASLRARGLVDSRVSDAHGRVEYAITDEGVAAYDRVR